MNKRCLLASGEGDRDMCMIGVRCMGPYALVVLSTHMSYVIRDDVQNLVKEMATPIENCTAGYFGV